MAALAFIRCFSVGFHSDAVGLPAAPLDFHLFTFRIWSEVQSNLVRIWSPFEHSKPMYEVQLEASDGVASGEDKERRDRLHAEESDQ